MANVDAYVNKQMLTNSHKLNTLCSKLDYHTFCSVLNYTYLLKLNKSHTLKSAFTLAEDDKFLLYLKDLNERYCLQSEDVSIFYDAILL